MKTAKVLLLGLMVSTLAACSTTPTGDDASGAQQDRREGTGLLDRRSDVEVLSATDGQALQGQALGGSVAGLLDDETIGTHSPVIYFAYDQFSIDENSMKTLRYYANQMMANPSLLVVLEGHTDERGSPSYNLALGEKRSLAAAEAMMLYGVARERMTLISFGEEQPVALGHDEESWGKNRRVELRFN
jgi:peptidoglycan-associated lipoprotein